MYSTGMDDVADGHAVADAFLGFLRASFGQSLKEVWLFGSRARGDAGLDSDYDMLVIAEGELPELRRIVQEAEWQCMELWGALVASIVYTPGIWLAARCSPLGWNIQREGKLVA